MSRSVISIIYSLPLMIAMTSFLTFLGTPVVPRFRAIQAQAGARTAALYGQQPYPCQNVSPPDAAVFPLSSRDASKARIAPPCSLIWSGRYQKVGIVKGAIDPAGRLVWDIAGGFSTFRYELTADGNLPPTPRSHVHSRRERPTDSCLSSARTHAGSSRHRYSQAVQRSFRLSFASCVDIRRRVSSPARQRHL